MFATPESAKIAVIGLGYVGLPLAIEFAKRYQVVGFDINSRRISDLKRCVDRTLEVSVNELKQSTSLSYTDNTSDIKECNVFIITVPTPIDRHKQPNLDPLIEASELVARVLKENDVVIYESTVYPGATEEVCVPLLERTSGLRFNENFFVGYSPERINPGDKVRHLTSIVKVTSGSTSATAEYIDNLYSSIVTAGTYKAPSIRVAEAAKVIENTQRDLNIALVNELAIVFNKMGIDTQAVLEAAETKWNFLPFRPGLVGGHCIGVDPYYLTHKAEAIGYYPQIILAGRRLNDGMGEYVAEQLVKKMVKEAIRVNGSKVLVMGLAFKENCPDLRNTRVIDVIEHLRSYGVEVDVCDPWVDPVDAESQYGITLIQSPTKSYYDGIIVAVAHDQYRLQDIAEVRGLGNETHVLYDLKGIWNSSLSDLRL